MKKTKVTLKKGKKYKIQAKKIPASSTAKIMYRSSNKRIAKVTKKGVIKALKKGKCKITVKTSDGKKKVIIVKVNNKSKIIEKFGRCYISQFFTYKKLHNRKKCGRIYLFIDFFIRGVLRPFISILNVT